MGLASSLFSGISGLSTLGNAMTVIGDNISNVNTVGFKGSRVTFQDVLSQTVATTAGTAQVGRGTSLADITASFAQGSFESTDSTTDLGIGGEGFFMVRDPGNVENAYYTRAGEFRFDKDGNFTNPAGYIVRGWELDATTGDDKGSITDIVLQSFTSSPKKTDKLTLITNLDADATSKSATISSSSLGSTHDITIYYDRGSTATKYEYIMTCNPDEDNRAGIDSTQSGIGILGRGVITFNESSGAISDIDFDAFDASNTTTEIGIPAVTQYGPTTPVASGTYIGTSTLNYTFTVNTVGAIDGATATMDWTDGTNSGTITLDGAAQAVGALGLSVDFGVAAEVLAAGDNFTITCYSDQDVINSNCWVTKTETVSSDLSTNGYFFGTADFLGGSGTSMNIDLDFGSSYNSTSASWENDSLSTTQYSAASTTTFQSANGYGAGDLQSVTVGTDGAITGQYSNGQVIPLYRVALAKFQNNQALFKVGGNLFRETRLSGDPITGKPGNSGLGSISPNSLEQSNVDIATEFVKMITTQRGFQANSKIITVTDQMLAELINLKR